MGIAYLLTFTTLELLVFLRLFSGRLVWKGFGWFSRELIVFLKGTCQGKGWGEEPTWKNTLKGSCNEGIWYENTMD